MKHKIILEEMIKRKLLPKEGSFEITEFLFEQYNLIYYELFPSQNKKLRNNKKNFNRKMTGLSFVNLLKERQQSTKVAVISVSPIKSGVLYVITNPSYPRHAKIGITSNLKDRLAKYQTYDPYRKFKIERYAFFEDIKKVEKQILDENRLDVSTGEWIVIENLTDIYRKYFNNATVF